MSFRAHILTSTSVAVLLAFTNVASAECVQDGHDFVCTGTTVHPGPVNLTSEMSTFRNMGGATTTVGSVMGAPVVDAENTILNLGVDQAEMEARFGTGEPTDEQILHNVWTGHDAPATLNGDVMTGSGSTEFFNFGVHNGNTSLTGMGGSNLMVVAARARTTGTTQIGGQNAEAYVFGRVEGMVTLNGQENVLLIGAIDHTDPAQSALVQALAADIAANEATGRNELDNVAAWFMSAPTVTSPGEVIGNVDASGARSDVINAGVLQGRVAIRNGAGLVANLGTLTGGVDMAGTTGMNGDLASEVINLGDLQGGVLLGSGRSEVFNAAQVGPVTKNGRTYTLLEAYTWSDGQTDGDDDLANDPFVDLMFAGAPEGAQVGTITGDMVGGQGSMTVMNLGLIDGSLDASHVTSGLMLVNSGTLTGGITGSVTAGFGSQGMDEIINLGTIGADGAPVQIVLGQPSEQHENILFNAARTEAFKQAYIQAEASEGNDISRFQALVTEQQDLTRAGVIHGDIIGAGGVDTIVNFGTINGSVDTGAGDDMVVNAGQIGGNVTLGAGNNQFIVGLGSVVGGVVDGGGAGQLTFAGASGYYDPSKFTNFAGVSEGWTALDPSNVTQTEFDRPVTGNVTLANDPTRQNFTLQSGASVGGDLNGSGTPELALRGEGTIGGNVGGFNRLTLEGDPATTPTQTVPRWRLDNNVLVNDEVTVRGGELAVNGRLQAPTVNIQRGASLGGSGTIQGNQITVGGFLRPGNSIGTTTVQADMSLNGQYVVEVNPTGAQTTDRLVMDGAGNDLTIDPAATMFVTAEVLNGVRQSFTASDFTWTTVGDEQQATFTVIEATNGATVAGQFASITDDLSFVDSSLTYGAGTVSLVLTRVMTTGSAALDRLRSMGGAASAFVDTLSTADGRSHEQLGAAGSPTASAAGSQQISGAVQQSMASLRNAVGATGVSTGDAVARDRNAWVVGLGATGSVDGDATAPGFDTTVWGFTGGADVEVASNLYAGVSAGYARSDVSADLGGETTVDSFALGAYGTYTLGAAFLEGAATYIRHEYDTSRRLGAATLSSSFGGNEFALNVGGGHAFAVGGWMVQPRADLALSHLRRDGFAETVSGGPAAVGLTAGDDTFNTGSVTGAVDVAYPYTSKGGWTVEPSARLGVRQRFGDTSGAYAVDYTGLNNPFTVQGPDVGNTTGLVGLGLKTTGPATALFARYDGEFNAEQRNHQITGGISFKW